MPLGMLPGMGTEGLAPTITVSCSNPVTWG